MDPPENFPFPFPPYPIQADFMRNLYNCLEKGNLGIFESPTGTGKTLSIICGSLRWLVDYESRNKTDLSKKIQDLDKKIQDIEESNKGDWFVTQTQQIILVKERQQLQALLDSLIDQEKKRDKYKELVEKRKKENLSKKSNVYDKKKISKDKKRSDKNLEQSDQESIDEDLLLQDVEVNDCSSEDEESIEIKHEGCKIFFCSRTHSQLSQFVGEIKKSPYSNEVSLVPLASRNNFCINPVVKSLSNVNMINDQCLQLQKKKTTSKKEKDLKKAKVATSCPYQPGDQSMLMAEILSEIRDIEDTLKVGNELKTCPYYSTRKSISDGQIILVPYNSILHKSTRISTGINLKNNILIIDEAHNLLDAIERMHTVTITNTNILKCLSQLIQYQKRFEKVLSAKNVLFLNQISFCLKKLLKIFGATSKSHPNDKTSSSILPKMYNLDTFEASVEIDTINIFDLINFVKKSKLIHKLRNYWEKYENQPITKELESNKKGISAFLDSLQKKNTSELTNTNGSEVCFEENNACQKVQMEDKEYSKSPLVLIISFFESLKSKCSDGRIFAVPGPTVGDGYLKFLLLNPAAHFSEIVQDARAVVLAGGTMEPMSEFKNQLFINAGANPDRIVTFSCDHVIPKNNILTEIVPRGPTGVEFEFNYQNRQNNNMLNELGRVLVNLCNVVPAGLVVFLPSYNSIDLISKHLENSGVLKKICVKKRIFWEPKSSLQVNQILSKYSDSVKRPVKPQNGSILFSVVGGKLSEGLNFSDDLGRCVVVVGLPYPNIKSLELQEKMKYLNENVNPEAGKIFYENSCMKAVNQCIGRAVRHINDYSTIILLDKRYAKKTNSLPGWIQRTLELHNSFGPAIGNIAKFFVSKKKCCDKLA